jgi:HD-GYP domain-containing protein (c-di-GMP phosphodiesterase class II)
VARNSLRRHPEEPAVGQRLEGRQQAPSVLPPFETVTRKCARPPQSLTLKAIRHHHEYLDGSGYPDGLTANQIGDLTRIMTVCDVYGALVERRAYKAPKTPDAALDILIGMAKDGKVELDLVRALRHCVSG